jgi:CRISPR type III-B/RAMP module RAMP protein Cmr6
VNHLPRSTAALVKKVPLAVRNPALQLDKLSEPGDQKAQKAALDDLIRVKGDSAFLKQLYERRQVHLNTLSAQALLCQTVGPLTLHLARASALENAGICLHPIYGFTYLPGSGLKGMARAYAETVWFPGQFQNKEDGEPTSPEEERKATDAWRQIEAVFGWAPHSDDRKEWKPRCVPEHQKDNAASVGSIIFHEAWPDKWPPLIVDITNNHHPKYYQGEDAPGDWENPIPVYFLAVPAGVTFSFALSKRRADMPDALLALAREWLLGALCHMGAGAKTAAGYGAFKPVEGAIPVLDSPTNPTFEATLEMITPGFVGGADQELGTPALRAPSLKAALRFWWRTMHGDWDTSHLRKEEAHIFGSTDEGQGISVHIAKAVTRKLGRGENMGRGGSPLGYLGYGPIQYDKEEKGNITTRDAIAPSSTYSVILRHRNRQALDEARRALWLLTAFGGIGSRSRRGWGSLSCSEALSDLPQLKKVTNPSEMAWLLNQGLEQVCPAETRKNAENLEWTAIGKESKVFVSNQTFSSAISALSDIGSLMQQFRHRYGQNSTRGGGDGKPGPDYHLTKNALGGKSLPHLPERAAFGLPYAQEFRSINCRAEFIPVLPHKNMDEGRRASPIFLKILPLGKEFVWVVTHLPAQFLPENAGVKGYKTKDGGRKTRMELAGSPDVPGPFGVRRHQNSDKTLVQEFMEKIAEESARPRQPIAPEPSDEPPPLRRPAELNSDRGVILNKISSRKANIRLDSGDIIEAGGAKQFSDGQNVILEQLPTGLWSIVGLAEDN